MDAVESVEDDMPKKSSRGFEWNVKYLQNTLTLGYFILLFTGGLMDIIVYRGLGIDILHYSSIFDLLVSPVITLLSNFKISGILFGPILLYIIVGIKGEIYFLNSDWYQLLFFRKGRGTCFGVSKSGLGIFLFSCSIVIALSLGKYNRLKAQIDSQTYDLTHLMEFRDGSEEYVMLIGQNTQYVFYVSEGNSDITVSPILTNIKRIVRTE